MLLKALGLHVINELIDEQHLQTVNSIYIAVDGSLDGLCWPLAHLTRFI
jgi:hypothetical protein